MASSKPAIVLIHGGWHFPSNYSKLSTSFKSKGYEVHIPALPSMNGARPPSADLNTDTALVRGYVESLADAGRTIIVIMHSYGGQVGTNALVGLGLDSRKERNLQGGIARLIYMCAFALPEGRSMVDKVREFGHMDLMPMAFDFAEDDSCVNRDPKTLLVGPGIDDSEADEYVSSLARWNGKCMYQEISQCAWREIPVTYIYTKQDMTVPLDYQKSMVEFLKAEGGVDVDTVELETGHCPNVTMTKEIVEVVERVAMNSP